MILDYLAVTLNNCVDFYSDYQIYLDNVVVQNRTDRTGHLVFESKAK